MSAGNNDAAFAKLEPECQQGGVGADAVAPLMSIAISLKRIADDLCDNNARPGLRWHVAELVGLLQGLRR